MIEARVLHRGSTAADAPFVVLMHGRGSVETDIIGLADLLPPGMSYAAVRAPLREGGGFAWFANRGIGRPVEESLSDGIAWFRAWLDRVAPPARPVVLAGFSGGATFAGGVVVIPAELQARSWEYLHGDSGAVVTARRSPGGHGLTDEDVAALGDWLTALVAVGA